MIFFTEVIIYHQFLQVTYFLLAFVRLQTFVLTYVMGIFYFILVWRGLKSVKFKKNVFFFIPTSNKIAIQNSPLMQLRIIFHKSLIKIN